MRKKHPLRLQREAQNLTREALAGKLGIGVTTLKRAEHGESVSSDTRQRLCAYFGQTSEDLGLVAQDAYEEQSQAWKGHQYQALVDYVAVQQVRLTSGLAPGSMVLRVAEITGSLFIPPPWQRLSGPTPHRTLADYLVEVLLRRHRLLLLGDAGQGKTTILKVVFARLADRFLKDPSSPLPVYIPLREYANFSGNTLDLLWGHAGQDFPLSYDVFASLVRSRRLVFLFDGFDEIPGEVSQRAINERAACRIFHYPSLLSCRKGFFNFYVSLSPLQEAYPEQVELQPLVVLSDLVTRFIRAYCQQQAEKLASTLPERILDALKNSIELQDLAQRPLLLMMMLELYAESDEVLEQRWTITKLYQSYTERWLKHEAAKPDTVLRWHEKAALLSEVAWQTTMGSAPQHALFSLDELHSYARRARYAGRAEEQVLDDLCFRTLLGVAEDAHYTFLHKSFQEYYAARYVHTRMRHDLEGIERVLCASLPHDIASYLKKMLRESSQYEKSLIADNLKAVYQRNEGESHQAITVRQQAIYYLSNLSVETATHFLEAVCDLEPNKWVQRGIMLGLALFVGKMELLERYIQVIRGDVGAAAINLRYHLIYYGDQVGNLDVLDIPEQHIAHSEKTVVALFRHLRDERYKNGWALDLLTLTALLEIQGSTILAAHAWYKPFLEIFLKTNHINQGASLQEEKERLRHFLGAEGDVIEQR